MFYEPDCPLLLVSLAAKREEVFHQLFSCCCWLTVRFSTALEGGRPPVFLRSTAYLSVPHDGCSSEKRSRSRRGDVQDGARRGPLPRPVVVLDGQLPAMGSAAGAAPGPASGAAGQCRGNDRWLSRRYLYKVPEAAKGVQTSSGRK